MEIKPQYRIVMIYLSVGIAWIFFSDFALNLFFSDTAGLTFAQNIKGWFFIAITAVMLFSLIRHDIDQISKLNTDLVRSYDQTINGWVNVMDLRHKETRDHTRRVSDMTLVLAELAGIDDRDQMEHIRRGAILHDIGKIGIPDEILIKPGKLNDEEWAVMKTHPSIAHDLLLEIDFLSPSIAIPYCHHEKWDGSGYPQGLKAEQIPLEARIFSIVDVWDALIHPRVYKSAWPEQEVLDYLRDQSGKHFDPNLVNIFIKHYDEIKSRALPA